MNNFILTLTVHVCVDFQKSPSSDLIWRGMKHFSYLIGVCFMDPKVGHCS